VVSLIAVCVDCTKFQISSFADLWDWNSAVAPGPTSKFDAVKSNKPSLNNTIKELTMNDQQTLGLAVVYQDVGRLVAYARNARTHSKHQIRQIAASIKEFGFTNPVLIDADNVIIAGHGRVEAAKRLRMTQVPTIRLDGLTPDQIRAYVIADNRLAEKAGWDESILAIELQHLLTMEDFDVTITGFEIPEIDLILQEPEEDDAADRIDESVIGPAVTRPGDLWLLAGHRLLCASALEEQSFRLLMNGDRAKAVFVDPPYNVKIEGHVCGNGAVHHREFAMASGEMTEAEFTEFLRSALNLLASYSVDGAIHYVCMDWRHMRELLEVGKQTYSDFLNLCVWSKDRGGMGSLYRSQHELVFVFRNGKAPHTNNIKLGKYGRNRTNVWEYPSINTLSKFAEEGNLLALHPTVKPVAMVADALLDCSARGDIVLDSFLGSGTTLLAAERVGRVCYATELDCAYVDLAIRRWQRYTGENAILAETGELFQELENGREG
jgi:DNA modification methylase